VEAAVGDFARRTLLAYGPQLTQAARAWLTVVAQDSMSILDDQRVPPEAKLAYTVASHGPHEQFLSPLLAQIAPENRHAIADWIEANYFVENGRRGGWPSDGLQERIVLKQAQYHVASEIAQRG
jgi:hypothetical protein